MINGQKIVKKGLCPLCQNCTKLLLPPKHVPHPNMLPDRSGTVINMVLFSSCLWPKEKNITTRKAKPGSCSENQLWLGSGGQATAHRLIPWGLPPEHCTWCSDATDPESVGRDCVKISPTTKGSYLGIPTWPESITIHRTLCLSGPSPLGRS